MRGDRPCQAVLFRLYIRRMGKPPGGACAHIDCGDRRSSQSRRMLPRFVLLSAPPIDSYASVFALMVWIAIAGCPDRSCQPTATMNFEVESGRYKCVNTPLESLRSKDRHEERHRNYLGSSPMESCWMGLLLSSFWEAEVELSCSAGVYLPYSIMIP